MVKELSVEQKDEMDKVINLLKGQIKRLEKELNSSNIIHHKAIKLLQEEIKRLTFVNDELFKENKILREKFNNEKH